VTTSTKTRIAYPERVIELVKAWGGSLDGSLAPDACPARHQPRLRCTTCQNTPPMPNILDSTPQGQRELRWSYWFGRNTFSVALDPIDVACEKAVQPSPEMIAAERLAAEKQAAYDVARAAVAVATAEHDTARGERKMIVRDGMFFTTGGRAVARLERAVEDARRRMEDAEHDLKRARADFGEHEEFLDNQRLVWRDKHRAEFA
jgi:hypothetical protein